VGGSVHDLAPAYLPDGRIVFLSTRPSGLVPCFNSGVAILHVMNADGSDIHPISVNNVNEFDPSILPDGRILFGRWEYVDKNALTIQSLWSCNPDGTQETAVFANNMVFPEAVLDARPVPGSNLIVGTFAKHNSTPRGSIAMIDTRLGKNGPQAIVNLEHPENPTCDTGNSCEPWPLSKDVVIFSGRPGSQQRNVIEMMDRSGHRVTVLSDPEICMHSPILIKPRPVPPALADVTDRSKKTGRFFLQDIYKGLTGVKRGEVKQLRVIEETSRISPTSMGGSPYNQVFLVSAALAFSVKNFLGVVPVDESGSAYFEVPSGRAVYLQAMDGEGRIVQSMRTFVQAAPGTTRSCIGCHEHKFTATAPRTGFPELLGRGPDRLRPESWGSGYVDYPSMVQPILDKHCVSCHGGPKDIAARIDLSGGWTEHFNISYENLVDRRHSQVVAYWISGIDCMNGTAHWSCQLFQPRSHGSGSAPLAQLLVSGHDGRIPDLTRKERDLLMAWMDTNGLYHGSWDQNGNGCAIRGWNATRQALTAEMQAAGCVKCHATGPRENDWINLKDPQFSRILRAPLPISPLPMGEGQGVRAGVRATSSASSSPQPGPLPKGDGTGFGLGLCRDRKAEVRPRVRLLVNGYAHGVQPIEAFSGQPYVPPNSEGTPVASFASTGDPHYQKMLAIIRQAREQALAAPRVDMPGAEVVAGTCRQFNPPPLPEVAPAPEATPGEQGVVHVTWERTAQTIGLEAELHRSAERDFTPGDKTLLTRTSLFQYTDTTATPGKQYYALVLISGDERGKPAYTAVTVPAPAPPPAPVDLKATPTSYSIRLQWQSAQAASFAYNVYRSKPGDAGLQKITPQPVRQTVYVDAGVDTQVPYTYVVRAVSRCGIESGPTSPATATAIIVKGPVFTAALTQDARGLLVGGEALQGKLNGPARFANGSLDVTQGGHVAFPHRNEFDLTQPLAVECWVLLDQPGKMPIVVSCGVWNQAGWFLQKLGGTWRWHVGGVDCDGGQPPTGRWMHMAGVYDGHSLRLYQDGRLVAEKAGQANANPWSGDLCVGQYSAGATPDYQTQGRIAGLKIYHRPLDAKEIAEAAKTKGPGQ
jgi:cytochrome c553